MVKLTDSEKDSLMNVAVSLCEELEDLYRIWAFENYLTMQQNFYDDSEEATSRFLKAFIRIVELYYNNR